MLEIINGFLQMSKSRNRNIHQMEIIISLHQWREKHFLKIKDKKVVIKPIPYKGKKKKVT